MHGSSVDAMDPKTHKAEEWGLEGYAIGTLRTMGYARDSFKVGDKITVTVNPRKDGTLGRLLFKCQNRRWSRAGPS